MPVRNLSSVIFSLVLAVTAHSADAETEKDGIAYGDNSQAGSYVEVNGIDMYFETYGSGDPLIVIHGSGDSIAKLHFQISHFSKNNRVIAADSRGHGKSGLGSDPLTYLQMMEDWNALMEHLDIRQANIIGWSDGGILALLLAIHHPDKVNKMAIMGANLRPDKTAVHSWAVEYVQEMSETTDEMLAMNDTSEDWPLFRQLLNLLKTQPNIPVDSLHQIEAPVLVMAGDKDIIRGTHSIEIFENISKAHLAILPGQTHWAPVQNPAGFNALVESFFDTPYSRPESRDLLIAE